MNMWMCSAGPTDSGCRDRRILNLPETFQKFLIALAGMEVLQETTQGKEPRVPQLGTRIVLWSPHQTHRFVVGSPNELRLYEWDHQVSPITS